MTRDESLIDAAVRAYADELREVAIRTPNETPEQAAGDDDVFGPLPFSGKCDRCGIGRQKALVEVDAGLVCVMCIRDLVGVDCATRGQDWQTVINRKSQPRSVRRNAH